MIPHKNRVMILALAILLLTACKDGKRYHDAVDQPYQGIVKDPDIQDILAFQQYVDELFADPATSPLPDRYRKDFKGLDFFEPDTRYVITAYLERTPDAVPFLMPTTTTRKAMEVVYGRIYLEFGGRSDTLEIYKSHEGSKMDGKELLFLPFRDPTNGRETYSGGRYIDIEIPEGDSLQIDFNRAYNPYCVYNPAYSCPIVPEQNTLNFPVYAGLKDFKATR